MTAMHILYALFLKMFFTCLYNIYESGWNRESFDVSGSLRQELYSICYLCTLCEYHTLR